MSVKPKSERVFETICDNRKVQYRKLGTREGKRTADYLTLPARRKVVVETKGIYPNERDRALAERSADEEATAWWGQSRKRVNKTIQKAAGQLRSVAKDRCPSILMIHDERSKDRISSESVLEAMYGKQGVRLPRLPDDELMYTKIEFGGDRQMTEEERVYISAVGVMKEDSPTNGFEVHLYHNVHASDLNRLGYDTAAHLADKQFALATPKTKQYQRWEQVR